MEVKEVDFSSIPQLSNRDRTFTLENEKFESFQSYISEFKYFEQVIANREQHQVDRSLLHSVLQDQYSQTKNSEKTSNNLAALKEPNTFTVTTAHQPSLLTGPLYYIFKILSAVNLADRLRIAFPSKQFVPVFVIGGEDHDFEEINHCHLYGKKIEWETAAGGPVGELSTSGLDTVLIQVKEILGDKSLALPILEKLSTQLSSIKTYAEFSFRLTHILFDHLGLVILRMNNKKLKSALIPTIKKEIFEQASHHKVTETQESIKEAIGYDAQAHVRDINFFYLSKNARARIEKEGDNYIVKDLNKKWTLEELTTEIHNNPERFSPNVVMRPIYQETILPNLAYIGGGGEIAYWTERKSQFEHFGLPFPMLIRRTSGMIITPSSAKQMNTLGLSLNDSFSDEQALTNLMIQNSEHADYHLTTYKEELKAVFDKIAEQVEQIDKSIVSTTKSEATKAEKSIDYLESKLKKAIKQKEEVNLQRIAKLKKNLFPKGLQERHDNILQYISRYGPQLIDELGPHCDPFDKKMKVFFMQ